MAHPATYVAAGFLVAAPFTLFAVDLSFTLQNGQVADAEQVMVNFVDLKDAIDVLEAGAVNGAIYCGSSTARNGNLGGYTGAKALCETTCSNAAARMCTGHDLLVSNQAGVTVPFGDWYSTGTLMTYDDSNRSTYDCDGWVSSSSSIWGPEVYFSGRPDSNTCNEAHPVACCL
jgi:hypothetical protein